MPPREDEINYLIDRIDVVENVVMKESDRDWQIRKAYNDQLIKQQKITHLIC